jgi:hypothetical protein
MLDCLNNFLARVGQCQPILWAFQQQHVWRKQVSDGSKLTLGTAPTSFMALQGPDELTTVL